ncbi:MAG: trigger factor [Candidatus Gastranaerophilales bacterium]|nr:trigger factor [Candidatus Gastranaerophilales bacterium]
MAVTIEKLENNEIKLNIEVESSISSFEYDKACKKLAQRVNVPGFRQGKAPKNILEKYVGIAALQREVLDSVLPTIFENTIEENNFDLASAPNVESYEFAEDKTLKVVAKFELKPEVNLEGYKGIEIEVEEFKKADDAIDKELQNISERYAVLNDITDRKSTNTDLVNIDFDGYVDGEEIKGGSAKNYLLDLAHSNFIPGFAEQLVEKNTGEEFKINVKFPDEYHDEKLKGKDAEFNIKINSIKEKVLPEINDDLAKRVNSKFSTLEALKEDIQKYIDSAEKNENERRTAVKIFETLLEKTNINIQETMINREIQALMGEFKQRVNMQGGNFDEMLEKEGHQKIYEQLKEEAIKRIKTSLIVGKIAQNEKMSVTTEDVQRKINNLASVYRTTTENIVNEIQKNVNMLHSINQQIITEKVTKFLVENAKINYTKQ